MPSMSATQGLLAGSGGVSAFGQIFGGFQQQQAEEAAATQYQRNAQVAMMEAGAKISAVDTQATRTMAAANSAVAASGGTTTGGSARVVKAENASQAIKQEAFLRYGGELAKSQDLYAAQVAQYQGRQAQLGGLLSGGSSLLTTAAFLAL